MDATEPGLSMALHLIVIRVLPEEVPELFVTKWPDGRVPWAPEERQAVNYSRDAVATAARLLGLRFEIGP